MTNYKEQLKQLQFNLGVGNSDSQVVYNGIPAKKATFKAGLEVPIHRWFRLTPINWRVAPAQLDAALSEIERRYMELDRQFTEHDLENGSLQIPPIHDPFRWWRKDVLKKALCVKLAIQQSTTLQGVKDFFLLGLAGILVPDLTNVTLGRLQLHFIDRSEEVIDVWTIFYHHARMMINDLSRIVDSGAGNESQVYHTDSTSADLQRPERLASLVITSPPYPNRYSYVWNTRPHLYFLDFFNSPKQASDLDKQTVGGTWGTATSALMKGVVKPENVAIKQNVSSVAEEIRRSDNLMANYLIKYFNLLAKQIVAMERVLQPHAKLAYVVGCSRLKGVYVETDVLLAKVIESLGLGYHVTSVERIRRRHSDKDLHESIVYAQK
jgi:hypothetical protein